MKKKILKALLEKYKSYQVRKAGSRDAVKFMSNMRDSQFAPKGGAGGVASDIKDVKKEIRGYARKQKNIAKGLKRRGVNFKKPNPLKDTKLPKRDYYK